MTAPYTHVAKHVEGAYAWVYFATIVHVRRMIVRPIGPTLAELLAIPKPHQTELF